MFKRRSSAKPEKENPIPDTESLEPLSQPNTSSPTKSFGQKFRRNSKKLETPIIQTDTPVDTADEISDDVSVPRRKSSLLQKLKSAKSKIAPVSNVPSIVSDSNRLFNLALKSDSQSHHVVKYESQIQELMEKIHNLESEVHQKSAENKKLVDRVFAVSEKNLKLEEKLQTQRDYEYENRILMDLLRIAEFKIS